MADSDWLDEEAKAFLARRRQRRRRFRLKPAARIRLPFLKLTLSQLDRISQLRLSQPSIVMLLEMMRLSGLWSIQQRDGWAPWDHARFKRLGLHEKSARYRAVRLLVAARCMETQGAAVAGRKLEYRLLPDWAEAKPGAKSRSKVIDLAAARKARKRSS
jgi:hypothetical protein